MKAELKLVDRYSLQCAPDGCGAEMVKGFGDYVKYVDVLKILNTHPNQEDLTEVAGLLQELTQAKGALDRHFQSGSNNVNRFYPENFTHITTPIDKVLCFLSKTKESK